MIMEDYRYGHRIREFVVEARTADGRWVEINSGTAVGRKRIVMFEPVEATMVTLRITKNVHPPLIRDFKVYFVEGDSSYLYEKSTRKDEVSRNAKATASDEHSAPYVAGKICDGSTGTWWGVSTKVTAPYKCWVALDLGREHTINETAINEPWNRTEKFQLEYRSSETEDWKIALTGTTMGADYKKKFTPATGRYWRLNTLKANHYPSIKEWKLFSPRQENPWRKCYTIEPWAFNSGIARVRADISEYINHPGQFLLRFDDMGEHKTTVTGIQILYDGHLAHRGALSTISRDQIYLLNRQAQVVDDSEIVLQVRFGTQKSNKPKIEIFIKRLL
jgi:hypothetical protein